MSLSHGSSIVLNGLITYLDAANPKSYAGSGATWADLTKNGNFTLNGGYSYNAANNGYISFDGAQGSYSTDANQNLTNFGSSSFSVQIWINFASYTSIDNPNEGRFCEKGGFPTAYFIISVINSTHSVKCSGQDDALVSFGVDSALNSVTLGQWYMVTFVMDRTNALALMYLNTTRTSSSISTLGTFTMLNKAFSIPSSFAEPTCSIGTVKLYNTALTDSEVLQNFNATRGRYGL